MWREQPLTQPLMTLFFLVDLPLCLVADTALLPVPVIESLAGDHGSPPAGEPPPTRE